MAVSSQLYSSKDGDILDQIVFAHYGDTRGGKVEAVLAANIGLAAYGAILPGGVRIELPELAEDVRERTVQLWG